MQVVFVSLQLNLENINPITNFVPPPQLSSTPKPQRNQQRPSVLITPIGLIPLWVLTLITKSKENMQILLWCYIYLNIFFSLYCSPMTPALPHRTLCTMTLERKCCSMLLRVITSASSLMARQELANPTPWWASRRRGRKESFPWFVQQNLIHHSLHCRD